MFNAEVENSSVSIGENEADGTGSGSDGKVNHRTVEQEQIPVKPMPII